MKIKNLKKKIIIKTDKNNIPIPGFHLTIIRDIEDPEKIKFIYTAPDNTKLLSQDDVKLFNDSLDIDLFPFKILYSNLTEDEKELLRESRQEKIEKKRKDDLNEYLSGLKIKQKYDKSLNHYKRKIMNMPSLTLEEKREKIKKHKLKCVNCQKNVGNIFVFQENGLHIKCGDQEAPCDFNKLYKKPSVLNMVVKIKELKERMNTIKEFIIRTKLEMIFKLDVKEELLKKFKKFNERYKKIKKEILFYEKKKEKNQKNKERKEKVEIEKIKLEGYKKVYIESIDNYISTRTQSYLSDAIELYIKDILVLEEKIRNLSFAIITIDKKKDEFELIKQRNTISSEELYL